MPMEPMPPVLVGVDGTPESLDALDLAAEEAAARVTPLIVVHATDPLRADHARAAELLAVATARVRAEHPGLAVATEDVLGDPAEVLLCRAWDACLLVVGHRAHQGREMALHSTAMRVARRAAVPVLVHRPLHPGTDVLLPRPVVVGVGGADAVVGFAFDEAAMRGAPLQAVSVWPGLKEQAGPDGPSTPDDALRALTYAVERWADKYPDVRVTCVVRHSLDVTVPLTAASRSAQLVVVGGTHRIGLPRLLAGTIAQDLVHRAGCPVAVVPA